MCLSRNKSFKLANSLRVDVAIANLVCNKSRITDIINSLGEQCAVVLYQNEQYKVSKNDVIMVPRMNAHIGEEITFKKCLLVTGKKFSAIGRPFLENVRVLADVEEHKKSHNVIYYLDRHKRKNISWVNSQNQVTILRIKSIVYHPCIIGMIGVGGVNAET